MRVLTVGSFYPPHDLGGGYELTWRSSVDHLRATGSTVRILASDFRDPDVVTPDDPEAFRTLQSYWHDHEFPRRSWRSRLALERHNARELDRHLDEFAPDVVCWWSMGTLSMGLVERVRRRGLPAVGVVGDEWLSWGPRVDQWIRAFRSHPLAARFAERITGLPARIDLGEAALWLFNSEHVRTVLLQQGLALKRSAIAHPGIEVERFESRPARQWADRLLCLGRLDPRKGTDVAIRSLAQLPEMRLTIQGTGEAAYRTELGALVEQLGLAARVTFSERPRAEIPDLCAEHDALLFPVQWEEPWGLVPLEAMAVGRPVVASGTGGSAEYLRNGENCLIYAPRDDPAALAAAIRRLAADPALRHRLRTGGAATSQRFPESAYNEAITAAVLAEAAR